jgi:hypothetical protein
MATKEDKFQPRILSKSFTGTGLQVTEPAGAVEMTNPSEWTVEQKSGEWLVYQIQSIDLSGYTLQQKTTFIQSVILQDIGYGPGFGIGPWIQRGTFVTTTPMNGINIHGESLTGQWEMPGSPGSTFDLRHVIMGRGRLFTANTNIDAKLALIKEWVWGTGTSTAADRIWLCDAYLMSGTSLLSTSLPSSAFVIPVVVGNEPDLEYMMRLARSVEPVY